MRNIPIKIRTFLFFSLLFCASISKVSAQTENQISSSRLTDSIRVHNLLKNAWELKYSEPKKAMQEIKRSISLSKKSKEPTWLAKGYYYQSIIYFLHNKFDSAIAVSELSWRFYRKTEDNYAIASLYNLRGQIEEKLGNYGKAISDYQTSLNYARKTDNLYGQSNPLHNIGLVYSQLNDHDRALDYFFKALKVRETLADTVLIGQSFQIIGVTYNYLGNTQLAINYQEKAIKLFKIQNDLFDLALVYSNLGTLYTGIRQYQKAEKYLKEALQLQKQLVNPEGQVRAYINLAELHNARHAYSQSLNYLNQALPLALNQALKGELKNVYQNRVIALEGIGNFKSALQEQKSLIKLTDSLLNTEKVKQLATLETRYQVREKEQLLTLQKARLAKQEAQIQKNYALIFGLGISILLLGIIYSLARSRFRKKQLLLQKDKEIGIKEAYIQATIQSQEEERKRFAQDLHDGLGQLISALKLMLRNMHQQPDADERAQIALKAEDMLRDMHTEIRDITFNLMPQTLIQYGLVPALKEMALRLNETGQIIIKVNSYDLPERLTEIKEITLYRIIQEWLNNILKYAQATRIEIQLVKQENEINITIEDNGKGFDTSLLKRAKGNGWKNINSRLSLLKGVLEIDSIAGKKGTSLLILVPDTTEQLGKIKSPEILKLDPVTSLN